MKNERGHYEELRDIHLAFPAAYGLDRLHLGDFRSLRVRQT